MKRGDIYFVSFDPSVGGEIRKTRPAVIVSNDLANKHLNRVQVVPITSNADNLYPSEMYIKVGKTLGKAMADQITTASKERLRNFVCKASRDEINSLERIIKIQLGLS